MARLAARRTRWSCQGDFAVPLVEEVEPIDAVDERGGDLDAGRAAQLLRDHATEEIGDVTCRS